MVVTEAAVVVTVVIAVVIAAATATVTEAVATAEGKLLHLVASLLLVLDTRRRRKRWDSHFLTAPANRLGMLDSIGVMNIITRLPLWTLC